MADEPLYDPFTGRYNGIPADLALRPDIMPKFGAVVEKERPSVLGGGIRAGWNQLQASYGGAAAAVGELVGSEGIKEYGREVRDRNSAEMTEFGRPDLEIAPWREGGASVLPWLGYQVAKQVPQVGAALGASLLVPQAAIPGWLAALGARVPAALGGGGLRAGASAAAMASAQAAGQTFARGAMAATLIGAPQGAGEMFGQAMDRGGETAGDAAKALALGIPYGAMEALQVTQLGGLLARGAKGNIAQRVMTAGAYGALTEMPTEAVQTAMELSFRPDIPLGEKLDTIVDAAITGAAVGGVIGGAGGLRRAQVEDPALMSDEGLSTLIDDELAPFNLKAQKQAITNIEAANPRQPVLAGMEGELAPSGSRPFAAARPDELLADLQALDQRRAAGQATPQDQQARAEIAAELGRRDQEVEQASPLAQQDTRQLERAIVLLDRRAQQEQRAATPEEVQLRQVLSQEIARRAPQQAPQEGLFPAGTLPAQTRAESLSPPAAPEQQQAAATEQQVETMRERARSLAGGPSAFINSLQAKDDADIVVAVYDRLEEGDSSARTMRLAERIGLLDSNGQLTDPRVRLTELQTQAEAAWDRVRRTGQGEGQARELSKRVAQTEAQVKVVEEGLRRREARSAQPRELPAEGQTADLFGAAPRVPPALNAAPEPAQAPGAAPVPAEQQALPFDRPSLPPLLQAAQEAEPAGAAGEQLRAGLQSAVRNENFDRAADQLVEQRTREARAAEGGPVSVVSMQRQGATAAEVRLSNGQRVELEMRPASAQMLGGWYDRATNQYVAPDLAAARAEIVARNQPEGVDPEPAEDTRIPVRDRGARSTIRYREADESTELPVERLDVQTVQTRLDAITRGWRGTVSVTAVPNAAALPDSVRGQVRADRAEGAYGLVDRQGNIYILTDNLPDVESAEAVLFHESLGHLGLASQFGKRLDQVLRDIYRSSDLVRREADAWKAANAGLYAGQDVTARATEEALVRRFEQGELRASLWDQLIAVVKDFARRMGLELSYTDAEVNAVLVLGQARVTKGAHRQITAGGIRYMYAGERAAERSDTKYGPRVRSRLDQAVAMDERGSWSMREIRVATGWFKAPYDGRWRNEIDDDAVTIKEGVFKMLPAALPGDTSVIAGRLDTVLEHKEFFEAYPEARTLRVRRVRYPAGDTTQGGYWPSQRLITLRSDLGGRDLRETLLHELQHYVQNVEGFAVGSSPDAVLGQMSKPQLSKVLGELIGTVQEQADRAAARVEGLMRVQQDPGIGREIMDAVDAVNAAAQSRQGRTVASIKGAMQQLEAVLDRAWVEAMTRSGTATYDAFKAADPAMYTALQDIGTTVLGADPLAVRQRGSSPTVADILSSAELQARFAQRRAEGVAQGDPAMVHAVLGSNGRYQLYLRSAGEIEAEEVARRSSMSFTERLNEEPFSAVRHAAEDVIVDYESQSFARVAPAVEEIAGLRPANTTVQAAAAVPVIGNAAEKVLKGLQDRGTNMKPGLRRSVLYLSTLGNIVERYGKLFGTSTNNALRTFARSHEVRVTAEQRMSQLALQPYEAHDKLARENPKLAEEVRELMGGTQFAIDPRKPWSEQPWLHDVENKEQIRRIHTDLHKKWNHLRQLKKADVYTDLVATNELIHYAQQAMGLFNLANIDPATAQAIPGAKTNPMLRFLQTSSLHEKPSTARDYWRQVAEAMLQDVDKFIAKQRGLEGLSREEQRKVEDRTSLLAQRARQVREQHENMKKAPYFHLGRFGEYFVSFGMAQVPGPDGKTKLDQRTVAAVAKRLEQAGFIGVEVTPGTTRANVFIRVETEAEANRLQQVVLQMQRDGLVDREREVVKDKRSAAPLGAGAEELIQQLITTLEATMEAPDGSSDTQQRAFADVKAATISRIRDFYLDQLPDIALARVMVHRDSVPGFSSDMMRSFAFRTQVGAHALANLASQPLMQEAITQMKDTVNKTRVQTEGDEAFAMREVMAELMTRESERHKHAGFTFVDTLRAFNHAYFLGLSPAYALTNLTQIGALLLPELAKKNGFVKSAKTIAKVTPAVLSIMRNVMAQGRGQGWRKMADAGITEAVLENSKLSPAQRDFVARIVNTGKIDIGGQSRELGRVVESRQNSRTDMMLRFAASFGFYTEMTSRLIAALAAHDLSSNLSPDARLEYAVSVVDQSMLNYSAYNVARFASKGGVAGPVTPLATSFLQYSFQLIEKLTREINQAFMDRSTTAEERAEARRFLGSHLVAITFLAGSLGLPAATVFARVVEAMVETLGDDDEPFDAKAAWRNFLADTFGEDVGEVLARGVPRAFGFDMSSRTGEADIVPFSRLLADRRDWKTATEEWAFRTLGAPISMIRNIVAGGSQMASGNIVEGMKEMMPVALKGPIEAYKMGERGYTDRQGNVLPMEVGARDILTQIMGFNTAEKAEYTEANLTQMTRRGQLIRSAANIRVNLAKAVEGGDAAGARRWISKAKEFDRANPGYAVLPTIDSTLKQRQKARLLAANAGVPLRTNRRDPVAQELTSYANY